VLPVPKSLEYYLHWPLDFFGCDPLSATRLVSESGDKILNC